MYLKQLLYTGQKDTPAEWCIEGRPASGNTGQQWLGFADITLIVGSNASGKTRTIQAIRNIADIFCEGHLPARMNYNGDNTASYQLRFDNNGVPLEYVLDYRDGKILQETLTVDGQIRLDRAKGQLWYEGTQNFLEFETDPDLLAISRRDKKQHSFFEPLYTWGRHLNHYRFGSPLGKDAFLRDLGKIDDEELDLKDADKVAMVFIRGEKLYAGRFTQAIIADMKELAYDLSKIGIRQFKNLPFQAFGLFVQEHDLQQATDQLNMSQGMFRALSLLIQLNYSLLSQTPGCVLIDDIGEGLDHERARKLIGLIIDKIKGSKVQVIMTTNDRFVMNNVPLEYWSVIQRTPNKSLFYNYQNSRETFDEYRYSGMSNFDFLATGFYMTGFADENAVQNPA